MGFKISQLCCGIFLVLLFSSSILDLSRSPVSQLEDTSGPYPTPESYPGSRDTDQLDTLVNKIYLPMIANNYQQTHWYAQGIRREENFYGVWANITTEDPKIREPLFSYMSINILGPQGHWVETGWFKSQEYGCVPKWCWATQEGNGEAHIIASPSPNVEETYGYMIYRVSPGNWLIRVLNMSGYVLIEISVSNPGMDYGVEIEGAGEVDSPNQLNDMGLSQITELLWKRSDGVWQSWSYWIEGYITPPYWITGKTNDPGIYMNIGGNQGNPIPPGAPCP